MDLDCVVKTLCEGHAPSGRELWLFDSIKEIFKGCDDIYVDNINNIHIVKNGSGRENIMITAHLDEVFLVVTEINEDGTLEFMSKGIDPKTLVSKEVIIHGKEDIFGIIQLNLKKTNRPKDKGIKSSDLVIDTGLLRDDLEKSVKISDFVTLNREYTKLLNGEVACKAFDDRAGVAAMYVLFKELISLKHEFNVHLVCTSQEEVGHRGAKVASYICEPTIGIALDTTFEGGKLGDNLRGLKLGEGPTICIGPNIHPKLRKKIMRVSKEEEIPYQVEVEPGNTGTDAWDIQISRNGIATLLISIPIKYMHTSVEVCNLNDIKNTGLLLSKFICSLKEEEVEDLLCF